VYLQKVVSVSSKCVHYHCGYITKSLYFTFYFVLITVNIFKINYCRLFCLVSLILV